MPRPRNKTELLDLSAKNYQRLVEQIASMSPEQQVSSFPPGTLNRNIRYVLSHLHHWHTMMLSWYEIGMTGDKPEMPAKGYTWKTTSQLNQHIWELYQGTNLEEVKRMFEDSYQAVRQLIEQHSDEELFTKKRYHWTGSTSLGAYLISATSSHYDWAYKLIKKSMKALA